MIKRVAMVNFPGNTKEYAFLTHNNNLLPGHLVRIKDINNQIKALTFVRYDDEYYFQAPQGRKPHKWLI